MTLSPDPETCIAGLAQTAFGLAEALETGQVHGLIDASCDPLIATTLEAFPEAARCLFDGETGEDLREVAPWLVRFERHGPAWDWFTHEGWGANWGILVISRLVLPALKARLKLPLRVEDETGKRFFFKYYRPGHLNTYLPAMDEAQRHTMFSGADAFLAEAPDDPSRVLIHRPDCAQPDLLALAPIGAPLVMRAPSPDEIARLSARLADKAIPEAKG